MNDAERPDEPSPVTPGEAQRGCPKCGGAIGSNHLTGKPECYRCGPIPPSVAPGEPERPEPQGQAKDARSRSERWNEILQQYPDELWNEYKSRLIEHMEAERDRAQAALRKLERVVVELYPGHAAPDEEHLEEYRAVWTAVYEARAAMSESTAATSPPPAWVDDLALHTTRSLYGFVTVRPDLPPLQALAMLQVRIIDAILEVAKL